MKINLSAFWNNSKDTVLRFPATIAFLAALTILMIENIILESLPTGSLSFSALVCF